MNEEEIGFQGSGFFAAAAVGFLVCFAGCYYREATPIGLLPPTHEES